MKAQAALGGAVGQLELGQQHRLLLQQQRPGLCRVFRLQVSIQAEHKLKRI